MLKTSARDVDSVEKSFFRGFRGEELPSLRTPAAKPK